MTTVKHSRGFTLMELLVAMTTFSIVMGGVYAAFNDAARFWRESENDIEVFHQARVTISVLERELRNSYAPAGFLFFGKGEGRKNQRRDSLEFFTLSTPMAGDQQQIPELMKVKYSLVSSGIRQRTYNLQREEQIVSGPLPRKQDFARAAGPNDRLVNFERSTFMVLAENVESLGFIHLWPKEKGKDGYVKSNDCMTGIGPPVLVQVEMVITDKNLASGNKAFRTTVMLPGKPGDGPKQESS